MSADSLNLRHLRVLCAVADHASISKAASRVHLSQPAITQALAKLETIVGARLFDRSGHGMFLNKPGEIFVLRARRALALIEEGARHATRRGAKGGTRRFSSFDGGITSAHLRALLAVVEAGNFSLAARAIGISQPSLHRTARDLERLAEVSFFNRVNLGIEVTASARALARKGRLAFGELEQGFAEIQIWRGRDTGRIVIGTMPLARTTILPRAINELLRARPDVDISVIDGPYDDLLHGLRHGEIDLLTGALRQPLPIGDVVQETLFEDPLVIVGRHGHPLCNRPDLSMTDLARYSWAIPRAGTPTREFFERMFARSGMAPPRHVIEASSLVLIRGLLLGSDRLTLMSAHQMDPEKGPGMLARMPFALHGTWRKIGVTFRRDWRPTATQTRFLDLLRQEGNAAGGGGGNYSKNE